MAWHEDGMGMINPGDLAHCSKGASVSPCPGRHSWKRKGCRVRIRAGPLLSMFSRERCRLAPGPKLTGTFVALQREITFVKPFVSFLFCK